MTELKQQSPNWEKFKDNSIFVKEGFPFKEGFPRASPSGNNNKIHELILRSGKRVEAKIDHSGQYGEEGRTWKSLEGSIIHEGVVLAWKER
ncbi:hypothetical protein HY837_06925 [archaeon]|nr:hypothetical protein [archaeon]